MFEEIPQFFFLVKLHSRSATLRQKTGFGWIINDSPFITSYLTDHKLLTFIP